MVINLNKTESPKLQEVWNPGKSYYKTNVYDDFFDNLIFYYDESNLHSTLIQNEASKIYGTGIVDNSTGKNSKYSKMFNEVCLDIALFNAFAIEVVWNVMGTKIVGLNRKSISNIRIAGETDLEEMYYYSKTWKSQYINSKWIEKNVTIYSKFDLEMKSGCQIYYNFGNRVGNQIYSRPDYIGTMPWIFVDRQLGIYYSNLTENNFVANTIINMPFSPEQAIKDQIERDLKENFTNPENAGSIVVVWNEGNSDAKAEILKFNNESEDQKYSWLSDKVLQEICIGHKLPNVALAGISVPGKLGNTSGEDLRISENIYNKNVIIPKRNQFIEFFDMINPYLIDGPISYEINNISFFDDGQIKTQ